MSLGMLIKKIWEKKTKTIIAAGLILSIGCVGSAIGYSSNKDYGKAAAAGIASTVFAFGTGWYSRKRDRSSKATN